MKDILQHALQQIQQYFHDVIPERAGHLVDQHKLELPDITGTTHRIFYLDAQTSTKVEAGGHKKIAQ